MVACAYPFARMADQVGPSRDRFADVVSRLVLIDSAMSDKTVKRMVARAAA